MKPQHLLVVPLSLTMAMVAVESFSVPASSNIRSRNRYSARSVRGAIPDTATATARNLISSTISSSSSSCASSSASPRGSTSLSEAESAHGMPWKSTIGQSEHEQPLLYMPFWEWQMEYMKSELTNLEPDLDALSNFGYQENTQKKARIVSQCYKSLEYRKIRMTYYDAGDNTQVFNSVWYPDPKYNLPILGIDLLSFNRKKYLAIVDFQPLHAQEEDHAQMFTHRLAPIKNQYQSLKGQMSSKFYDETQFFSKQMLFARFEEEKVVHKDLFPAFKRYVMMHNRLVKETHPEEDAFQQEKVLARHVAYDTYSAERDPATGLFAAMFGKEWADDYVFDFLFSMSERNSLEQSPELQQQQQGFVSSSSSQQGLSTSSPSMVATSSSSTTQRLATGVVSTSS